MTDSTTTTTIKKKYYSIIYPILLVILAIEAIVFIAIGYYYVNRFNAEIDYQITSKLNIPSTLLSQQVLNYNSVQNPAALSDLVGETVEMAMVIRDGTVFFASADALEGKNATDVLENKSLLDIEAGSHKSKMIKSMKDNNHYMEILTPLYSGNNSLGFLYLKINETNSEQKKRQILYTFLFATLICTAFTTIVLVYFLSIRVLRPISSVVASLKEISKGDLTQTVIAKSNDEIGLLSDALDQMRLDLSQIVKHIIIASQSVSGAMKELFRMAEETRAGIKQISSAMGSVTDGTSQQVELVQNITNNMNDMVTSIKEISTGADKQFSQLQTITNIVKQNDNDLSSLSQITQKQTKEIELTKITIKEMATTIEKVAEEAGGVAANSIKTSELAQKGDATVINTVAGMKKIEDTVMNAGKKIEELGHNSNQIGEIIEVINNIAEQTNLLALNAAIEAARAGEHGRGFAVVADEVRKLAERSSKSTKEIADLIKKIQVDTNTAVSSMKKGTNEVQNGSELILQTREALKNILSAVGGIVSQIQNISAASEEMTASSSQSAETMNTITTTFQKTVNLFDNLVNGFKEVVSSINNATAVARNNQQAASAMHTKFEKISDMNKSISLISTDTSTLAEEVTASTEEIDAAIENFNQKTQDLNKTVNELSSLVEKFIIC